MACVPCLHPSSSFPWSIFPPHFFPWVYFYLFLSSHYNYVPQQYFSCKLKLWVCVCWLIARERILQFLPNLTLFFSDPRSSSYQSKNSVKMSRVPFPLGAFPVEGITGPNATNPKTPLSSSPAEDFGLWINVDPTRFNAENRRRRCKRLLWRRRQKIPHIYDTWALRCPKTRHYESTLGFATPTPKRK